MNMTNIVIHTCDYLDDSGKEVELRVALEPLDDSPIYFQSLDTWFSEKDIRGLIGVLRDALKIRKTGQV